MRPLLRFADLQQRKIIPNRTTLSRRIAKDGFPPGFLLGPNSRVWREEDVEAWLDKRAAHNATAAAE